ncbi:MAG TPA: UDP-N-acetylmuramate dehydrogenase [Verrucomicrobiae bacterium]|nr:UDP-N-acetylmuramate dehydrogenase [Verrucomicrobiae bacterium]
MKARLRQAKAGELLYPHTTMKVGGPAELYVEADSTQKLIEAVIAAREIGVPYFVMAGGSNLVIDDAGLGGLVIRYTASDLVADTNNMTLGCEGGLSLWSLVQEAGNQGWAGLENLAGIPGSVGGAVFGNAGAFGYSIGEILESGIVLTPANSLETVGNDYFKFRYRHSYLKESGDILLSVKLKFKPGDKEALWQKMKEILTLRAEKHPPHDWPCAGSFFKNIEKADEPYGKLAAGILLDKVGAKNLRIGQAGVYHKHANIIVNYGGARFADIRRLANLMRQKVFDEFGITLEEEIRYVDGSGRKQG